MKTTRIRIRNLFGIEELTLDGKSIELSGKKGIGKTSVLDAIRYALTNRSDRDYVIKQGAEEGEILIETTTGLSIDRRARTEKADYINVKEGDQVKTKPAAFLSSIFTPLQLNPIEFTQMSKQEKNRVILNLIDFDWNLNWIREQFGELPQGVDYEQHILQVLHDIQAESGSYYQSRQNINRDIRNQKAMVADLVESIPLNYNYKKWNEYDMSTKYRELESKRVKNSQIEQAKAVVAAYDNKVRGIEAQLEISRSVAEREINDEKTQLKTTIERLKAELKAAQDKLGTLDSKLADKLELIQAKFETAKAEIAADLKNSQEAAQEEPADLTDLQAEIDQAEEMRKHLKEYEWLLAKNSEIDSMTEKSEALTEKIEIARELPGEILRTAKIPVAGLTVKDGIPLINDLPISNLSDGELLELCVDVTVQKPGSLEIILLDGAERLDSKSRAALYKKCKEKGLQLIATRVSDSDDLEVTEL